jgi:transmembrane sensor
MDWLLRLEAAPSDTALKRQFELWLGDSEGNRAAFRSVQYTWKRLGGLPRPESAVEAPVDNVVALPVRRSHRTRWLAAGAALAAACLALVVFPVVQRHILSDHVTGVAEVREIVLPDGSIAYLDADSAIAIDYADGKRGIDLVAGQAFFQVVPGANRPFVVKADELSVTVTGTAFDVGKTSDAISVAVASGTVEVSVAGEPASTRLELGDRLILDRRSRSLDRRQVAPAHVASWRARRLVVHGATFAEVIEQVGRHQAGLILVTDRSLDQKTVSGVFDLSHPHEALNALAESQGAKLQQFTPYLLVISTR